MKNTMLEKIKNIGEEILEIIPELMIFMMAFLCAVGIFILPIAGPILLIAYFLGAF